MNPTSVEVEVEPGVALHVVDSGPPADPGSVGRAVVLLAGLGLDHESWAGPAATLARHHRVVRIDLRGTGGSDAPPPDVPRPGGYSLDRLAGDVVTVLDHLDLCDVALIGHSFGAQVAVLVAEMAGGRVSRLGLVCSNGVRASRSEAFPFGGWPDRMEEALVHAELENSEAARRRNVLAGFGPAADPDPGLVDRLVGWQLRMPPEAMIASFRTYLHADLTAELAALKMPVLQILGADDPVTAVDGGPWVQERLADGTLVVLDRCGHYPMFEARDRLEGLLADFVSGRQS